jgi:hypothetical protein
MLAWARGAGVLAALVLGLGVAFAEERHSGYYYPQPQSYEVYKARAVTLADSDRTRRIGFVTIMTRELLSAPYAPNFAIFAKGEEAEKLIIVGLEDGRLNTIYRARALFAMLTAMARDSELFRDYGVQDLFTFFDLCKLLGFSQLTVTDGVAFSHQVAIE